MNRAVSLPGAGAGVDPFVQPHLQEARRVSRRGMAALLLGMVPLVAWLALAPLASAVVAPGHVKVDLDRVPVQHLDGGPVREVLVRDGQRVQAGDPLLTLGDVRVDADRNRLALRVLIERAGIARLEAEQTGAAALAFSPELIAAGRDDERLAAQIARERDLFGARRDTLTNQVNLLQTQRAKIAQELEHLRGQVVQSHESLRHQSDELRRNQSLVDQGFISGTRISQLEASLADQRVRLEERQAESARAEQRLVDTELRMQSLQGEYRQQAGDQLKVANARLAEIEQEMRKSEDAAQRQVITAPASGTVLNLRFTTPGGVIPPREPIADIVPADPRLLVEARIDPADIERVRPGQLAHIRFTAFHPLTTPLVEGRVVYIAADRQLDRQDGRPFYIVHVEADAASLKDAGSLTLQAGMPADVQLRGAERTALQYLAEPLTLLLDRAGRER
ncbi:HlyD family type I secretion periplasmic adaptor subunit [Ramlibacter sp. AW1]|uniref:Membrane fusion protein (MFP) family protein n=1 Tax=Ramlibacter aurantiacus TaxID=2801330 RepID=A0A936ZYH6_9BURK|nr:HlyD family type I secretion periplasmic adaptor subunit [Ramlibacter aurantiacus]MBL0422804.1 HlyD family type I secretion periplasmic adaptor subunit [Ramlibacter aurantiacus]